MDKMRLLDGAARTQDAAETIQTTAETSTKDASEAIRTTPKASKQAMPGASARDASEAIRTTPEVSVRDTAGAAHATLEVSVRDTAGAAHAILEVSVRDTADAAHAIPEVSVRDTADAAHAIPGFYMQDMGILQDLADRTMADLIDVSGWKDKANELRRYVSERPAIKRYAILEDLCKNDYDEDPELKKHLVFVDPSKGLQVENCIEACGIMNGLGK